MANATLANGQLAATATTLLAGADAPSTNRVEVVCQNTGTAQETVILTYRVGSAGTARRVVRAELAENEQLIVSGLALMADATLLAITTTASVVDYVVVPSSSTVQRIEVVSPNGTSKGVAVLRQILSGMEVLTDGELADQG